MLNVGISRIFNVFSENGEILDICIHVCQNLHVLHVNKIFLPVLYVRKQITYISEELHAKHTKVLTHAADERTHLFLRGSRVREDLPHLGDRQAHGERGQTLQGSFSAVPKPKFAGKY